MANSLPRRLVEAQTFGDHFRVRLLLLPLALSASMPDGGLSWPRESDYPTAQAECPEPLSDGAHTIFELALRVFGPSPLHEQGEIAANLSWRCWEAANGDGTILLLGRGELHEELRIVGAEMAFSERGNCPRAKLVSRGLAAANGLRLGLGQPEVEKQLGGPSRLARAGSRADARRADP